MRARTSSGSAVLRGGGEADQVAEQDGDDLALLLNRRQRGCSVSGAPQNGQNGNSPGSSLPQAGQVATRRV